MSIRIVRLGKLEHPLIDYDVAAYLHLIARAFYI